MYILKVSLQILKSSSFALSKICILVVGKISIITDLSPGGEGATYSIDVVRFKPTPGEKIIAANKPNEIATAVVSK